jgi:3-phenylpropionate/trans-cinnamate dioxygenase ferredoxin reductase subunit
MKRSLRITFWLLVYAVVVFGPLVLLLVFPRPPQRTFWRDFSVGLGFAGLSLLGLQFLPTGRTAFLSSDFPLDTLYTFHHRTSLLAWALALAHPVILFIDNPYTLQLLNVFTAPWRARAAVGALLAMTLITVSSIWRKWMNLDYEPWRGFHAIAALLAGGFGLYHMFEVGYYSDNAAQRVVWFGITALGIAMQVYVRLIKPWWMHRHPYKLMDVIEERGETWTLVVEPQGHPGLRFKAGQVAWLTIGKSPFGFREHPFSMASSAERPERLEFAIRELGGFTSQIGEQEPGTTVYLDGPYGTFDLDHHPASSYVLIAGGIGIAPMMSIMRTMADREDDRPLLLIYGNRSWETATFREEIDALKEQLNLDVVHVLEKPPEDWVGETGFITAEVLDRQLPEDRSSSSYFVCGPLMMIDLVRSALQALDVPRRRIHAEEYEMA